MSELERAREYAAGVRADGPLGPIRVAAAERLAALGFPGRKDEAWKYTRAAPLLAEPFGAPAAAAAPSGRPWADAPARVVFVDGVRDAARSRVPEGVALGPIEGAAGVLGDVLGAPEGFDALNLARLAGGVHLRVTAPLELHLVHLSSGRRALGATRHRIDVADGASLLLYEHWEAAAEGPALSTGVVELSLGAGATVTHVRLQDEAAEAFHVGTVAARVGAGARYDAVSVALGAAVARVELRVRLDGEGASTGLAGLSVLQGHQHADHHVTVHHAVPHGTSTQVFRSIVDDTARTVFTGRVVVARDAQKTDSSQLHHALLLSDGAVANARPQLEIDADDVKCAHGAAVGALDPEALFYLRQRGLDELEARSLLTSAFAATILERLPPGPVREALTARVAAGVVG